MSTLLRRDIRDIHSLLAGVRPTPLVRSVSEDHPILKPKTTASKVSKPAFDVRYKPWLKNPHTQDNLPEILEVGEF